MTIPCILTFGHSTTPLEEAAVQLRAANVEVLIDVRSHPTSRWPQFQQEQMARWLPQEGISYEWWPELGGWDVRHAEDEELRARMTTVGVDLAVYSKGKFPKQRIAGVKEAAAPGERPVWYNQGLYDYAWFMSTPEFMRAANMLLVRGLYQRVAITCCELLWWRCHRSMIADWLVHNGSEATHMQPKSTIHSSVLGNRVERYDPRIIEAWDSFLPT